MGGVVEIIKLWEIGRNWYRIWGREEGETVEGCGREGLEAWPEFNI